MTWPGETGLGPLPCLPWYRASPHLYGLDALEAAQEWHERHGTHEGRAFPLPGMHAHEAANLGHSRGRLRETPEFLTEKRTDRNNRGGAMLKLDTLRTVNSSSKGATYAL